MPPRRTVSFVISAALAVALPLAAGWISPAAGAPVRLSDSTIVDRWTLPNGLRVIAREVPRSGVISTTVGYRYGSDDDPAARQGLAQLVGQIAFTAATAGHPARTVSDLNKSRPQGWAYPVTLRQTLFTEVALPKEFPAALAAMGDRMRGVRFGAGDLAAAVAATRKELGTQGFGPPEVSLAFQVREIGRGATDEQMVKRAQGAGLEGVTAADVQAEIARSLVPANAVLSIAGELHGVDLHALVQAAFGGIPGGAPRALPADRPVRSTERVLRRNGAPAAVFGVIAPSLSDSTHTYFYAATMLWGTLAQQLWSKPGTPEKSRVAYNLFDDPELPRLFIDVRPSERTMPPLNDRMQAVGQTLGEALIPRDTYDAMVSSVGWLLGGPMSPALRNAARGNPGMMMTLSRSQAGAGLQRGFEFWDRYRRRLEVMQPGRIETAIVWLIDPAHQVRVLSHP